MLRRLHALRVQLSLDDFGTGYSSLSYLHRFPLQISKIDRSFVGGMNADSKNAEIVRAIVALARNLGMEVVAEGVETAEHLTALRALQCPMGKAIGLPNPLRRRLRPLYCTPLHSGDKGESVCHAAGAGHP